MLRGYLAAVFAYAAVGRALSPAHRRSEEERFGIPGGAGWAVIALEAWLAWGLVQGNPHAPVIGAVFLAAATILMLARHHVAVRGTLSDLSTYQPTAMSVVLHITFIVSLLLVPRVTARTQ